MDLLKSANRRSAVSTALYNILNVGLAVAVLIVVLASGSPLPALLLVLLSKWRVLAVRPRYWLANIQANMVDLIVSFGVVILLFGASGYPVVQVLLTILYVAWLLVVKPKSSRKAVAMQAAVAVFVGITALYMISYAWSASGVVLAMWAIGYATARHVMGSYNETHILFLSLVWGFVFAELGWLTYHWAFAYGVNFVGAIQVPQAAVIALGLSFLAERSYASIHKHGQILISEILLPLLLTSSVILLLFALFNEASVSI